jgi:hypothetical protein
MVVPHPPFPAKLDRPAAAHDCVVFSIAAHVPLAYAPIRPLLHAWKESMARYILGPTSDHCSLCSRRRRARAISCGQLEGETLMFRRVLSNARKRKTDLSTHRTLCERHPRTPLRGLGGCECVWPPGRPNLTWEPETTDFILYVTSRVIAPTFYPLSFRSPSAPMSERGTPIPRNSERPGTRANYSSVPPVPKFFPLGFQP